MKSGCNSSRKSDEHVDETFTKETGFGNKARKGSEVVCKMERSGLDIIGLKSVYSRSSGMKLDWK